MKSIILIIPIIFLLYTTTNGQYYDTSIPNPLVKRNDFINHKPDNLTPPSFDDIQSKLPEPIWPGRKDVIKCYWNAWKIAFSNLRAVTKENNFIAPYIDAAFNKHIFMWDSTFMMLFARYGSNTFNFLGTLDNFYNKQHVDGFISREIAESNGNEIFEKFDPSSTGPNIMPWAEWEYYLNFKDKERLKAVFIPLLAYYRWLKIYRCWPDGSYYSSGWGCGMDNQPRIPPGFDPRFSHGFMSWIDTTLQQIFAGKTLIKMAKELGNDSEVNDISHEIRYLTDYVNNKMWDPKINFFKDRFRDGSLSNVKSIASYWALLAEIVPENQIKPFLSHLENPNEFSRSHRVPTLSADDSAYNSNGGYWCGGVWAPTTYMVLRGLTKYNKDSLAYKIAINHLDNVVKVFNQTGSLWENYAPDKVKGNDTKDMVGWTGLVPISILFEYVFGIRPNVPEDTIVWDIRMTDEFGIDKYPFKQHGLIKFWCAKREKLTDRPKIKIQSNVPFTLKLIWDGGSKLIKIKNNQGA